MEINKTVKQIASVAILLLGLLLVFGNLSGNLGFTQDSASTPVQQLTLANNSIVTFTGTVGKTNAAVSSVVVINATGGETIAAGNYTLTNTTITGSATTDYNATLVNVSYTTTYDSDNQINSEEVITDVTSGVTNLSDKFGTIFTLLGVILLVGAIVWMLRLFGIGGGKKKGVFSN